MRIEDLRPRKILINTVAKVASASFLRPLKEAGFDVHHGHSLMTLRRELQSSQDNLIISGIRNPLERNLSYFFQTYSDKFYNNVQTRNNSYAGELCFVMEPNEILSKSPIEIIKLFFEQPWHNTFNDWFYEFIEITKIDKSPFCKDVGFKIYDLGRGNWLLFYKFEKLSIIAPFLEAFFWYK